MSRADFQPDPTREPEPGIVRESIVIAGEFEVGKSSVLNAFLRQPLLPNDPGFLSRPLVRVRHRNETMFVAELMDGSAYVIPSLDDLVERDDVASCTIHIPMPGLEAAEIVEIPFDPLHGFDPDHVAIMQTADLFIWVTIASQAWRLSEKSIVQALPEEMRERSVLAISRTDKLRSAEDIEKIQARVDREAAAFFNEVVFMRASAANILASEEDDKLWTKSGGRALIDIARETLGDMSVSEQEAQIAYDNPIFGRRASDQVEADLPDVEFALFNQTDLDDEPIDELSAIVGLLDLEEDDSDPELEMAPPVRMRRSLGNRVAAKPAEQHAAVEDTSADEAEADSELDFALEELVASVEVEAVEETVEPEPVPDVPKIETPAEKLERGIYNLAGLETGGVVNFKTKELLVRFAESEIQAEQCIDVFSNVIDTNIRMMNLMAEDDTVRETSISAGDYLILLQLVEDAEDQLAFFVLKRDRLNTGISSFAAKRLLGFWQEAEAAATEQAA